MRTPLWVPHQPGGLKRVLHLASFALSSLPVLCAQWRWKPDVVWVVEPRPDVCAGGGGVCLGCGVPGVGCTFRTTRWTPRSTWA